MEDLLKSIELEFTILEFYEGYVISVMREGVVFGKDRIHDLVQICSNYYQTSKFVYISNRLHNYNVDPTIYLNLENVGNLAGIAIVSQKASSINMANFEKNFSKVPFSVFLEMEEARKWVGELLNK
jgi:hypothetical protein